MTIFITNFRLLDHTIERLSEFNETELLLVHCAKESYDILNDVQIKLSSINVPHKLILAEKYPITANLTALKYILLSRHIIFDDFSGKDIFGLLLSPKITKTLILHDVTPHMGEHTKFSKVKKYFYPLFQKILVCSQHSYNEFMHQFPNLEKRLTLSHIPPYNYKRYGLAELSYSIPKNYLLIFGRISPYKGIPNFLDHYKLNHPIIIAGQGDLVKHPNVLHINRFIPVNELNTLINQSKLVVLPYLEATQSGVLSVMSGFTEIPVLIRNIQALQSQKIHHPQVHFYEDSNLNNQIKQLLL